MDQIASFIQGHDHFVISSHISPDADALSSALALYGVLKRLDKHAAVVMSDPVPRNLTFLPGAGEVLSGDQLREDRFEQAILVDCGKPKRIGEELYERLKGLFTINIDHHLDNPRFGQLHHVRHWASCTMAIAELIEALDLELDVPLATCLYTGLVGDTNAFRNANVDASVLATATRWVEVGVDPHHVATQLFERQSWEEVQLLAYALGSARREGRIVWCAIPHRVFKRFGVGYNDTDGIVAQLRAIEGVDVAALFKELEPGRIKVSLRAKGEVSVNEIAQQFGGGGHLKAAGCLIKGALDEVVESVVGKVRAHLTTPVKG